MTEKTEEKATLGKAWGHFRTITRHKLLVGRLCFKVGLYRQGLLHDLSKYAPIEFMVGARFFQGDKSPNTVERITRGYSNSWLHHKGRNKHHFEYWLDFKWGSVNEYTGMPMPTRYIVEMLCDRIAACKVYQGDAYTQRSAYEYYMAHLDYNSLMHDDTASQLEEMLFIVAEEGEDAGLRRIRREIVKPRKCRGEAARW